MFQDEIAKEVSRAARIKQEEAKNMLEIPPSAEIGDFALPCFALAKTLRKNPTDIARELAEKIKPGAFLSKIVANGPYLNFFIDKKNFAKHILSRVTGSYGKSPAKKERIILEHTSVNPNASPHVGRARNAIIGDSIKRILEYNGHPVETHYYVNDVSKQVALLALIFSPKDKFNDLLGKYVKISKKLEKNPGLEREAFAILEKFEKGDKKTIALFKKIVDTAVSGQKEAFSKIGIEFDYFDYESAYIKESRHILEELRKTGKLFEDREGRLVLDQKNTELGAMMKSAVLVLTRSDKTGLYPLRDLAYTIDKGKKGRNIIVLGEDQKLYFKQVKHALALLKKPSPDAVHYSFVLLKGKGKMSTRRGEVVLLEGLLGMAFEKACLEIKKRKTKGDAKKVAIGAVKYAMLKNDNDKNILFDLSQSLNFEGDTGPYLQYSYARAGKILRKSRKKPGRIIPEKFEEKEIELIKQISLFPQIVKDASISFNPSIIAHYAFQLAQVFSEFYHSCQVIDSEQEEFRLKLVDAFRTTLKNALYLLGIDAIEEM